MPEPPTNPEPVVYQLRIVLRGVSPLIWRRLHVRSDSTIADLHASLQRALGWSDEHLNRFVIHGREYGVWHDGGIGFRDDPRHVRLADLGLRVRERFLYEYDFTDGWQHDVRLEQILPIEPGRYYPVCIGGRRAAPPEDCGGPWAFLELRQHYSAFRIADRLLELLKPITSVAGQEGDDVDEHADDDDDNDDDDNAVDDHYEELVHLLRWLKIDRFDRRAANGELARIATAGVA
jgi:Plasmid pRiA4b ORF-3-like protein